MNNDEKNLTQTESLENLPCENFEELCQFPNFTSLFVYSNFESKNGRVVENVESWKKLLSKTKKEKKGRKATVL